MSRDAPPPPELEGRHDRAGQHRTNANATASRYERQCLLDADLAPLRARRVLLAVDLDVDEPDDLADWWAARVEAMSRAALARRHRSPVAPCCVCGWPAVTGAHGPCAATEVAS